MPFIYSARLEKINTEVYFVQKNSDQALQPPRPTHLCFKVTHQIQKNEANFKANTLINLNYSSAYVLIAHIKYLSAPSSGMSKNHPPGEKI